MKNISKMKNNPRRFHIKKNYCLTVFGFDSDYYVLGLPNPNAAACLQQTLPVPP